MARRKLKDRNIRKIIRMGGSSLGISLPVEFLRSLRWREGQKLVVRKRGERLVVEDWEKGSGKNTKPEK